MVLWVCILKMLFGAYKNSAQDTVYWENFLKSNGTHISLVYKMQIFMPNKNADKAINAVIWRLEKNVSRSVEPNVLQGNNFCLKLCIYFI